MKSKTKPLRELCTVRMGYTFREKPEFTDKGNVLVIQPRDVTPDGELSIGISCRTQLSADMRLRKGDVLLINRGRFTATVFDVETQLPCVAMSAFLVITSTDTEQLLPQYLATYFNSSDGQSMFKRLTETTTIPFISLGNLESVVIPVPSLERQKALAAVDEMNRQYRRLCARKVELQRRIINRLITP